MGTHSSSRKQQGGGESLVNGKMRIGGLAAGSLLSLLAFIMIGEAMTSLLGYSSLILVDNLNRGFELLMGLISGTVAGITIRLSLI